MDSILGSNATLRNLDSQTRAKHWRHVIAIRDCGCGSVVGRVAQVAEDPPNSEHIARASAENRGCPGLSLPHLQRLPGIASNQARALRTESSAGDRVERANLGRRPPASSVRQGRRHPLQERHPAGTARNRARESRFPFVSIANTLRAPEEAQK